MTNPVEATAITTDATKTIKSAKGDWRMWPSLDVASHWFDISSIALAVGACVVFIATAAIVWLGIVKEHHWDLLRERANQEIARAHESAGAASERASNAHERAAALEAEAEKSKENAAFLMNEASRAQHMAANASMEAARAIQKAEEERHARVKLEAQIAPRRITQEQQNELTARLATLPKGRATLVASPSTPEAEMLARTLASPLKEAGWDVLILAGTATATVLFPTGILVQYPISQHVEALGFPNPGPAATIAASLTEWGIEATALPGINVQHDTIAITISAK